MSENYKIREQDRAYFLTLTVVGWMDVFTRPNHKLLLVNSLKHCQQKKGLELYGYCIMPSHVHLITKAVGSETLSQSFKVAFTTGMQQQSRLFRILRISM